MLKRKSSRLGTAGQRELAKRIAHRVFKPLNGPRVDRVQMISQNGTALKRLTFEDARAVVLAVLIEMGVDLRAVGHGNADDVPEFFKYTMAAKINCALIETDGEQADMIRFDGSLNHKEYGASCAAHHICEILKNPRVFFERPNDRFEVKLSETLFLSYAEPDRKNVKAVAPAVESSSELQQCVLLNRILVSMLTAEQLDQYGRIYRAEFATPEGLEWLNRKQAPRPVDDEDDDDEGEEWKKAMA